METLVAVSWSSRSVGVGSERYQFVEPGQKFCGDTGTERILLMQITCSLASSIALLIIPSEAEYVSRAAGCGFIWHLEHRVVQSTTFTSDHFIRQLIDDLQRFSESCFKYSGMEINGTARYLIVLTM